ncbi:uncharacterized protein LOC112525707 [Cynara cardunculus var. scolymus]|uniref:Uncharacterized protein n=1 Tax=Cynara cardunculus var. scolymus TaxID=59895 RepID=A0A103Y7P7_CYNCS|nr:uncharacterized protein LOC112525707 [Cynara cardunculus var. scolymus]XP_024991710.1 uncharacterized protein LOC112525707 [Cynara cardunculus var. scolymus]KVI04042.1 hypothetical protein Ccrd_017649 [Cynara cardunculus var. scolymus]
MVQQTDSKFSEYVLANSETGFPNHDKKTALRDLQNENRNMGFKSDGSSLLKDNGPAVEAVKVSGTKRPQPECTMRSPHQQTPVSNNGHLVYVRRKTESEQHKNSNCNKANDQPKKLYEHDEKNHGQYPTNDSTICTRKNISEPKTSEGVSSTAPLVTLDSGKSNITSPVTDSSCLKLDNPRGLNIPHWEERYLRLQNFLKALDLSNQDDYHQMLRSLSSVGLSRIAVELEKRSIQLSLEEAREVQRAKLVDVLDKFPRSVGEHQSTK